MGPDVTSGNLTDLRGGTLGGHANKVPAQLAYENIALDATLSGAVSNVTAAVASKDTTYTPNVWVVTLTINQSLTYGDVFRLVGVTTCTNDANCAGTLNTDHLLYRSCTMNSNPPTSCEEALSGTSVIFATTYDPAGSGPGTISLSSATITRNPVLSFDASVAYTGSQAGAGSTEGHRSVSGLHVSHAVTKLLTRERPQIVIGEAGDLPRRWVEPDPILRIVHYAAGLFGALDGLIGIEEEFGTSPVVGEVDAPVVWFAGQPGGNETEKAPREECRECQNDCRIGDSHNRRPLLTPVWSGPAQC